MRRSSSNSFRTLTTKLLLVVTFIRGPGNFSLIAITCNQIVLNWKVSQIQKYENNIFWEISTKKKENLGNAELIQTEKTYKKENRKKETHTHTKQSIT